MNAKPKILIVDDKPENLVALEVVLRGLNVELVKANSGNEALKATLYHDFALALLDIQMPEMDGYELAEILRAEEKTNQLPFIFISAVYTDNLNVFKGYESGAFSFITKPFQPEILINKVKFFIEKHEQEIRLLELYQNLEAKNEELEFSNRELESFSYSVSHDLRAPIRAIDGYAGILLKKYGLDLGDEGRRLIGVIQTNSKRMGVLVDDLLAFSRLGKKSLNTTCIDVMDKVRSVLSEIDISQPHQATIKMEDLHSVNGDRSLLRQVWVNLISNAIKYSSKSTDPLVEIGSERSAGEIIYYVKDNGVGFNMEYANKLFEVFQRLHDESEFEGTGMGLAIAERIVVKHGGRIWADSKEGHGATFFFALPDLP